MRMSKSLRKWFALGGFVLLCFAVAGLGSLATAPALERLVCRTAKTLMDTAQLGLRSGVVAALPGYGDSGLVSMARTGEVTHWPAIVTFCYPTDAEPFLVDPFFWLATPRDGVCGDHAAMERYPCDTRGIRSRLDACRLVIRPLPCLGNIRRFSQFLYLAHECVEKTGKREKDNNGEL